MQKVLIIAVLCLLTIVIAASSTQCFSEEPVQNRPERYRSEFVILGCNNKMVYALLEDSDGRYKICVFDASAKTEDAIEPKTVISAPAYVASSAVCGDVLYISDSKVIKSIVCQDGGVVCNEVFADLIRDTRWCLGSGGKVGIVKGNTIAVYDIRSKTTDSFNVATAFEPESTTLFWGGEDTLIVRKHRDTKLYVVHSGSIKEHVGISGMSPMGGGLMKIYCSDDKEGKALEKSLKKTGIFYQLLRFKDGVLTKTGINADSRKLREAYPSDYCFEICPGKLRYFRYGKVLGDIYIPRLREQVVSNIQIPELEHLAGFTDSGVLFYDSPSGKFFLTPRDDEKNAYLPACPMVTSDMMAKDGSIAMLFADGTWVRVSTADWKPVKTVQHECLSGQIVNAAPQAGGLLVWTDDALYHIDADGKLTALPIRIADSELVNIEQNGTRIAVISRKQGFVFFKTAVLTLYIKATVYDLASWYKSGEEPMKTSETDRIKLKVKVGSKYEWRQIMNFLGEDGVFFSKHDDEAEYIPKETEKKITASYDPFSIRNAVLAGGFVSCGGSVVNLYDGTTTRIMEDDPSSPVSAWRLPGMKCAVFGYPQSDGQDECFFAFHLNPRNDQERSLLLNMPEGTRWVARDGGDILCISAFGRLLGRIDIPEWLIEK